MNEHPFEDKNSVEHSDVPCDPTLSLKLTGPRAGAGDCVRQGIIYKVKNIHSSLCMKTKNCQKG